MKWSVMPDADPWNFSWKRLRAANRAHGFSPVGPMFMLLTLNMSCTLKSPVVDKIMFDVGLWLSSQITPCGENSGLNLIMLDGIGSREDAKLMWRNQGREWHITLVLVVWCSKIQCFLIIMAMLLCCLYEDDFLFNAILCEVLRTECLCSRVSLMVGD